MSRVSDIFRYKNQLLNTKLNYSDLVARMEIEKVQDLKKALKRIGYSNRAISAIIKWYV